MAEQLTLITPQTFPDLTTWKVIEIWIDQIAPSLKVTFESDTGARSIWRLIVSPSHSEAQIRAGLRYMNQGQFKTIQDKSLQRWLLEEWQADGGPAGTVSGTPD